MTDDPTATPAPEPLPATESTTPEPPTAETTAPEPPAEDSGPSASEAWADVVARMSELGSAVAAWTRAAADNPENRRRLEDVRLGVNDMAKQADAAFQHVTSTDFGQQMKSGAEDAGAAIGDAAQKVSDAAAPHVATAFAGLASAFGRAAHKVEEAAARQKEPAAAPSESAAPAPEAAAPPAPPAPPASEE
jgi:hypothetical protein